jgi:hypothetical protein
MYLEHYYTKVATSLKLTSPYILDRPNVYVSATEDVVNYSKEENAAISQRSPIHINQRGMRANRKKGKHPEKEQKHDCNDVDGQTPSPQIELGRQQRLAANPFKHDARDRDEVRSQHRSDAERDDLHVGHTGADINKRQENDEEQRHVYAVDRHL